MQTLKLHIKTTLLASVIIVGMLVAALFVTSAGIANFERQDDKALADTQVANLAQRISDMESPRDADTLTRAADLIKGSRPSIVSLRIWERSGDDFVEKVSAAASSPAIPIPEDAKKALTSGRTLRVITANPGDQDKALYRVFAATFEAGHPSGAVEIVERFPSIWSVAFRYVRSVVWMSVIAILLIMLGT